MFLEPMTILWSKEKKCNYLQTVKKELGKKVAMFLASLRSEFRE